MYDCLHRFLGECPKCVPDYDTSHHPNNYDCPRFYKIGVGFFGVIEGKQVGVPSDLETKIIEEVTNGDSIQV